MRWADLVQQLQLDLLWSLVVAVLLGGAIGLERELRGKAAGLRTNILICLGATLFTHLSIHLAGPTGDPGRVAAQVVTGIGFLGAGTILHSKGAIAGLTSAATIWLVAAIGVAIGTGAIFEAAGATLLTLFVLRGLGAIESVLQRQSVTSRLSIAVPPDQDRAEEIEQIVRTAGVEIQDVRREARGDHVVVHISVRGPKRLQDEARLALLRSSGAYTLTVEE
ncbi:MAG: MgtC/SapB family protein [Gemmatimonadetes bacterium]|nr:MgtC/SapB family protein [Gemmatimonadota bacterium]MBI3082381.1 MgtC/SapB family protein [Gemmatimonadota bacterium]